MFRRRHHLAGVPGLLAGLAVAGALAVAWWGTPAPAATATRPLPTARPAQVGLSAERLRRVQELIASAIAEERIAGAVTLVARRGRVVHLAAQGLADREARRPMLRESRFLMASSTKPVTGVAVLMLMEEGKLRLSDPISRFLPEFRDLRVAVPQPGGEPRLEPAARQVTIRDLLTHTSGLGSGAAQGPSFALVGAMQPTDGLQELIPRLAAVPLEFQPGTRWSYSPLAGIDLLGRIVEVVSGKPFDVFLRERIFEPLGMRNTSFATPEDGDPRRTTVYIRGGTGLQKGPNQTGFFPSRVYYSGAGGLVSSAEDFARFALMLAGGGQFNGQRLLSPRTVELMRSNHVGTMFEGQLGRGPGMGFGLTVEVVVDHVRAGTGRSNGSFGWDGAFGTHFWVDPKEDLVGVLLVQTPGQQLHRDYEYAVRQAIIE